MKYDTIKDATYEWVQGFNAIPQSLIEKAYDIEDITEITPPSVYDRVYMYDSNERGEITAYNEETETYTVELDNGEETEVERDDFEVCYDDFFPMWGTMWMFGADIDDWWLEEKDGLQKMADCGFRIYEIEEGYIFGIDGAGYDFYESHWIPLYKARGLHWHKTESEKEV